MPRSEGLLLAYLIVRQRPELREGVRGILRTLPRGDPARLSTVGQRLIRAKLVTPQEFLELRNQVEEARGSCERCRRPLVVLRGAAPKRRRCRCGQLNLIPPASPELAPIPLHLESESAATLSPEREDGLPPASSRRLRQRPSGRQSARRRATSPAGSARPGSRRTRAESSARAKRVSGSLRATRGAGLPAHIGAYPVLDRLGEGGMGLVLKVLDPRSRQEVALKLLRGGTSQSTEIRFRREAEAVARLDHPTIIRVHDVGVDPKSKRPFFTMDLVEGRELQELFPELDEAQLLETVARIADGLHHAHELGIVHRDIKPQNILIDLRGQPKITDFGLARDLGRSGLTEEGDLIGTPLFMSPEQLRGDPDAIDRRTDVYALGVVLYQGLTESLPYEAKSFYDLQKKIQSERPRPPRALKPELAPDLERVILKALEREPDDRYATAQDLARDLRAYLEGESVAGAPAPLSRRARREVWRFFQTPWGLSALALCALLVGLTAFGLRWQRDRRLAEELRQRIEQQRQACLGTLAEAQRALQRAHRELSSDAPRAALAAADEVEAAAAEALRQGEALGGQAPGHLPGEVQVLRAAAESVRARALARGGPAERDRARELYRTLVERNPADVEQRLALARLELEQGHGPAAILQLTEVLALDEERLEAFFLRAEGHRLAGQARFALFDYQRALDQPEQLQRVEPAEVLASRAQAHLLLGNPENARQDLDEAQRRAPRHPTVLLAQAAWHEAVGDAGQRLRELDAAAQEHPQDARLRLALGEAWAALGDGSRALRELDLALRLTHAPAAWLARGRLLSLLGRNEDADADLAEARARSEEGDPLRAPLRRVEVRHLWAQGKLDEALVALEPAEQDLAIPRVLGLERVELLLAARRHDSAGNALQPLLDQDPADPRAQGLAARIAMARHDEQLAEVEIGRLLQRHPQDALGLALRARLLGTREAPTAAEAAARAAAAERGLVEGNAGLLLEVPEPGEDALIALAQGHRAWHRARRGGSLDPRERAEELERALLQLQRAVAFAPWLAAPRVALAQFLAERARTEEALRELEPATWSGIPEVLRLRAELLAGLDRHRDAVLAFSQALRALEAEAASAAQRRQRGDLLLARARSFLALDRAQEAQDDLDRVIELAPKELEAYALRAELRTRQGDPDGAEADQMQVERLRSGYVRVFRRAVAEAWPLGLDGDHQGALRALEPALALVSRERDPERLAELLLIRAFMRLRTFEAAKAVIDLAAMLELAPTAFRHLFSEVMGFRKSGVVFNFEGIVERAYEQRNEQGVVDPDFLRGFLAFCQVEFLEDVPDRQLREGLHALGRYVDRHPTHASALLMRAVLFLETSQTTEALREVIAALDEPRPPPFAHYAMARLHALQKDRDAALEALDRALSGGFDIYERYKSDPFLDALRDDRRYQRLLDISQGAGYLTQVERAEERAPAQGQALREFRLQAVQNLSTGLRFLAPHAAEGNQRALRIAGRLHLCRARQRARQNAHDDARRDLLAALEAWPPLLGEWEQLAEGLEAAAPFSAGKAKAMRPRDGEVFPTRLRLAMASLLAVLAGDEVAPGALDRAAQAFAGEQRPGLRLLGAVILVAAEDVDAALKLTQPLRGDEALGGLAAWLAARALATRGRVDEALAALERARAQGVSGPLHRDPVLEPLAGDPTFTQLFPRLPIAPARRWR